MTFQEPPLGPGPRPGEPGDSGHDDYDAAIAARFSLLDQVPAPETWPPKPQSDNVRSIWPVWQSVGVAAAAAVLLAVAVTTLLPDRDDGALTVDAAEGPRVTVDEPTASDSPREDGDETDRAAFGDDRTTTDGSTEGSEDERPTLSVEPDENETKEDEAAETDPPGNGSSQAAPESNPEADETTPGETTPPETRPADTTTSTTPPETRPEVTEVSPTLTYPKESRPTLSVPPESRPTTTVGENEDRVVVVRGLVTEVFTDCQSMLILTDDGEVERGGPISCDGGSHIVVDGVRIQTSAGYVASDQYYDKHPRDLLPGRRVQVTARIVSYGERDLHTLDCDRCGVELIR